MTVSFIVLRLDMSSIDPKGKCRSQDYRRQNGNKVTKGRKSDEDQIERRIRKKLGPSERRA
jgi:hypothetical protein